MLNFFLIMHVGIPSANFILYVILQILQLSIRWVDGMGGKV